MEWLLPCFLNYCRTHVFSTRISVLIVHGYHFRQSSTSSHFNFNIENKNSVFQSHQIHIPSGDWGHFSVWAFSGTKLYTKNPKILYFLLKKGGDSPSFTSVEPNYNFNYCSLTVVANSSSDSEADSSSDSEADSSSDSEADSSSDSEADSEADSSSDSEADRISKSSS
jgi:hypothetical protein